MNTDKNTDFTENVAFPKEKKRKNFFVKILIVAFMLFCGVTIVSQQMDTNQLLEGNAELSRQLETLQNSIAELKQDLARPFDDDYVIQVARSKLNYHLPEEILYYNDLLK